MSTTIRMGFERGLAGESEEDESEYNIDDFVTMTSDEIRDHVYNDAAIGMHNVCVAFVNETDLEMFVEFVKVEREAILQAGGETAERIIQADNRRVYMSAVENALKSLRDFAVKAYDTGVGREGGDPSALLDMKVEDLKGLAAASAMLEALTRLDADNAAESMKAVRDAIYCAQLGVEEIDPQIDRAPREMFGKYSGYYIGGNGTSVWASNSPSGSRVISRLQDLAGRGFLDEEDDIEAFYESLQSLIHEAQDEIRYEADNDDA